MKLKMNLESLILNVCEMKNTYSKKFDEISKQKDADFDEKINRLHDLEMLCVAMCVLDQVLELVDDGLRKVKKTRTVSKKERVQRKEDK